MSDIDTAEDIAALKAAVAALQLRLDPPPPEPAPAIDSRPAPLKETLEEVVERIHKRAADHKALEKSYLGAMTVGCELGTYRDPCGLLRSLKDGKMVPTGRALEQQLAMAAEHDKRAQEEDLAWRRAVELPIRHGAGDDDDE